MQKKRNATRRWGLWDRRRHRWCRNPFGTRLSFDTKAGASRWIFNVTQGKRNAVVNTYRSFTAPGVFGSPVPKYPMGERRNKTKIS